MSACPNCNKLILEVGVTYGINPNAICRCSNTNHPTTEDNELQDTSPLGKTLEEFAKLLGLRQVHRPSVSGNSYEVYITPPTDIGNYMDIEPLVLHMLRPQIESLIASEVAKAELAMLDRLTEPHHDTMHGTYDYDGIAESVLNERNTLEGKL